MSLKSRDKKEIAFDWAEKMNAEVGGDTLDSDLASKNEFASLLEGTMGSSGLKGIRRKAQDSKASQGVRSKKLSVGDLVQAEILVIGKEEIFVSLGGQTGPQGTRDGIVHRREMLSDLPETKGQITQKVGDVVPLYVIQIKGNEVYLSPKPTSKNLSDNILEAYQNRQPIEGRVTELCNGGFRVAVQGKSAFCPISQIDTQFVEKGDAYVGQKFDFLITQISEGGRNIVVSRRRLMAAEQQVSQGHFLQEHAVGDVVLGKIKRLEKFGAFIELAPGLEGLAHISELSWSRVNDPAEVVNVGDSVSVKVLKIETVDGKTRIGVSIKQAGTQPWESFPDHIRVGEVVQGMVTRCMPFGAFVQVTAGIEGLVPLSEMSYTKRVMKSDELFKEGDSVLVMVKEIHPETRKILLSLKDAGSDPWAMVAIKFPVGSVARGKVDRKETYGLFVKLDDGIVGLLPKGKAVHSTEFSFDSIKLGTEITVGIAELNVEERKMSLDLPKDPSAEDWANYVKEGKAKSAQKSSAPGFGNIGAQLMKALENKKK